MIEAHTLDAWTRAWDRQSIAFRNLTILGGFAAPLFLWLAGVAAALAAERQAERSGSRSDAMAAGVRRGLQIFILAFLFRLQAFIVSPGGSPLALFRVDILNVMGPAIAATAIAWGLARSRVWASIVCATIATAIAMTTPIVRGAGWVDALPVWIQWYLRPAGDHTTFTLFPWAGFVFAGAAIGALLRSVRTRRAERALLGAIGLCGATLITVGFYAASRPALYGNASFWTSSPTYFSIRVGALMLALAALFGASRVAKRWPAPFGVLERFGRRSLFVYWIHVELVYGYVTWLIHGRLPLWATMVCYLAFCTLMYGATILRDRVVGLWRSITQTRYFCGI